MKFFTDLSWRQIDALDREKTAIIMPIASIEQHGYHLPVGTDYYLSEGFCKELAKMEFEAGECVIMPTLQYGLNTEHINYPGTIALGIETIISILRQQIDSLYRHGFRNFLIFNTHGGNIDLVDGMVRTYRTEHKCRMDVIDYISGACFRDVDLFENQNCMDCHAGEFETSMMQYFYPELVDMNQPEDALCSCNIPPAFLPRGWITDEVSSSGVMGNALLASPEKGKMFVDFILAYLRGRIDKFLSKE